MPISLILIFALGSLGIYGFIVGGWASDSKYSLLGSMRTCAQLVSYEVALAISVLGVIIMAARSRSRRSSISSRSRSGTPSRRSSDWSSSSSRASPRPTAPPFDLPEAETELVAGYHTEYSGMRFGLFSMAEYINMIMLSALAVTLFFGGWHGPWAPLGPLWFLLKLLAFIFVFIWLRATLPRLRYDQLMRFGWKILLPVATINALVTAAPGGLRYEPAASRHAEGLRRHAAADLQEADHAAVPGVQAPGLPALPRPPPVLDAENGLEKCVGCSLCAAACPADCIRVVAEENTADNRVSAGERYARIYEINLTRCIFCGYCELACPFDAITLENEFEISEYSRDDLIYTKDMLLAAPIKRVPVADRDLYDTPIPAYKERSSIVANVVVWAVWVVAAFACLGSGIAVITFTNPFYSALALSATSARSRSSSCSSRPSSSRRRRCSSTQAPSWSCSCSSSPTWAARRHAVDRRAELAASGHGRCGRAARGDRRRRRPEGQ